MRSIKKYFSITFQRAFVGIRGHGYSGDIAANKVKANSAPVSND